MEYLIYFLYNDMIRMYKRTCKGTFGKGQFLRRYEGTFEGTKLIYSVWNITQFDRLALRPKSKKVLLFFLHIIVRP